jgi:hypothetical protein
LPAEDSPYSGTTRVLSVAVTPARAHDVAETLRELVGQVPTHPGIVPLLDAGVSDSQPFIVTAPITGETLDEALTLYGPAALADALPRLQQLADALDCAADAGMIHGALTPADVIVSSDETLVSSVGVAGALEKARVKLPLLAPYAAPEVVDGARASARSDQFSLAVIAFEWLFGRAYASDAALEDLSLPGIDGAMLSSAFSSALAARPEDRFASCTAFIGAIAGSALGASATTARVIDFGTPPSLEELPLREPSATARPSPTDGANGPDSRGFSATAIGTALVLGAVVGGVAMWTIAGRRGSANVSDGVAVDPPAQAVSSPGAQRDTPRAITEAQIDPPAHAPPLVRRIDSAGDVAPVQLDAGLLVHSVPAGALVTIDGVPRGRTPVAVRGLDLGRRTVLVSRPGYRDLEREVVLTTTRPSRTLEVEMSPLASSSKAPSTAMGASNGHVAVDSRPTGAAVFVDGRDVGVTPMMLTLPAGSHSIRLERAGYRAVTARVEVKAGERSRVAARLEGGTDEE